MKRTDSADGWATCFAAIAILVLAAAGCEEKIYQIDLVPRGDKIERRLTLSRRDLPSHSSKNLTPDDRAELELIARAYGTKTPGLPRKDAAFSGRFGSTLPKDVGGDGRYVYFESPLGRVRMYVERFRGNDDVYSSLEKRRKAVDQIVDLLVGWFESELKGQPEWVALRTFLDGQFRTDLQNFSLLVWSTNVRDIFESTDSLAEVAVRAAQYLVERNYLSYDELPALRRESEDAQQRGNATALLARLRRLIVARAGGSEARWEQALGFLSDPNGMQVSWHRFFWQSPYFKKHLADIGLEHFRVLGSKPFAAAATRGSTSKAAESKPIVSAKFIEEKEGTLLGELFWSAFAPSSHFLSDVSRVQATLQVSHKPFWTNGKWNEKERRVEWSPLIAELPKPNREESPFSFEWPTLCFAAWDEPNEEQQKKQFGNVGLTGDSLLDYCTWYSGLSALEKREWDSFLPTVKKGEGPAVRLKSFRFSNEQTKPKNYQSVATDGASVIEKVIYPDPETRRMVHWGGEAQPLPEKPRPK
ncbi:MAG TPA: hypothetical protein VGP76_13945 [Planctomycetaceae bacterium]|jgi:hypothetical protein|nr:hypothetical protein [Planctomycetaceae bacterium]